MESNLRVMFPLKIRDLSVACWSLLVFLMIALPVNLQMVKLILIMISFLTTKKDDKLIINISHSVWIFYTLWMMFFVGNFFIGIIYDTPGKWAIVKLNVLYFAVFFLLLGTFNSKKYFQGFIKGVYWANYFIAIYNIAYLLYARLGYKWNFPIIDPTSGVGLHETYTHITTTNLSMLIFTFPFMLVIAKNEIKNGGFVKWKWNLMLILSGIIMIFSGRRILWIVLIISLMGWIFFEEKNINKKFKYMIIIAVLGLLTLIILGNRYGVNFNGLVGRFKTAFSSHDEYGRYNVRYEEAKKLWDGFLEKPILGNGAGATLDGYYRAKDVGWAYELTYNKILYDGGIIGSIIYFMALISIAYYLFKRKSDVYARGMLMAYLLGVIANATNPYFSMNFDFLIFIIAPLLYLNTASFSIENKYGSY